jgi:hypothetical protein
MRIFFICRVSPFPALRTLGSEAQAPNDQATATSTTDSVILFMVFPLLWNPIVSKAPCSSLRRVPLSVISRCIDYRIILFNSKLPVPFLSNRAIISPY